MTLPPTMVESWRLAWACQGPWIERAVRGHWSVPLSVERGWKYLFELADVIETKGVDHVWIPIE